MADSSRPVTHRELLVTAYAALGLALAATRLIGLGNGFWHDEIVTVRDFVRAGPAEIMAGDYLPNNHQLFSMLAWATSSLAGESEVAFRLWSVIPFVAGVIVSTAWLHIRVGRLSGVLCLFLATASPLLLDISRQARGYGLTFLAMSLVIVAALEAQRSGRGRWVAVLCVAGVLGTWTLPNFGVAFLATGAVLLLQPGLRRRTTFGLGASIVAIGAWYAPHISSIAGSSQQEYGRPIEPAWLLTAPVDQILIPAFLWIDGRVVLPGLVWLPLVGVAVLLIGSSPLIRERGSALTLVSGVLATVVVIWAARIDLAPRFVSYLLVPMFILLASGMASILARLRTRPQAVRTIATLVTLVAIAVGFGSSAAKVTRLPREAHKSAAEVIRARASSAVPVYAHTWRSEDLDFYLERPVRALSASEIEPLVCERQERVMLVEQPFARPLPEMSCARRSGVRHYRFEQYSRGYEMNVWFIPAGAR